jgi:hypothetical protein
MPTVSNMRDRVRPRVLEYATPAPRKRTHVNWLRRIGVTLVVVATLWLLLSALIAFVPSSEPPTPATMRESIGQKIVLFLVTASPGIVTFVLVGAVWQYRRQLQLIGAR